METLINFVAIVIFIGGPIVPLLYLAVQVDHWHKQNPDPAHLPTEHEH